MADEGQPPEQRATGAILAASGAVLALVGATLAFALDESDPALIGIRLEPLGVIILAFGVFLLTAGGLVALLAAGVPNSARSAVDLRGRSFASAGGVGGLLAVLIGVGGVVVLGVLTLSILGTDDSTSVAVATSAFGVISAVVGAYLGIKTTADQTTDLAVEAQRDARVADIKAAAAIEKVKDVAPEQEGTVSEAMDRAAEEVKKTAGR